jgi:hypothetical protein
MRKFAFLATAAALLAAPLAHAASASAGGNAGLVLAARVGAHAPTLSWQQKNVLQRMLNGNLNFSWPAGQKILVKADAVTCRASNVDISVHSCEFTFGAAKPNIAGDAGAALYATLVWAGVPADGAAGTIFEAVKNLVCTIDPNAVKQRDGSGADCTFDAGP